MSNTRNSRRKAAGRRQLPSRLRMVFCCLLPAACCLLLTGCRMDMQDQPRYEYYEPGDKKFFPDGASSRATVEGTVPRQTGQYRDRDDYFYTGKSAGAQAGSVGASGPTTQTGAAAAALASVRGNVSGGAPGAPAATATG